jgi:hypothetical protein
MRGANVIAAVENVAFPINASRRAAVLTMNNMFPRRHPCGFAHQRPDEEDNITPVNSTHKEEAPAANWFGRAMKRSAWAAPQAVPVTYSLFQHRGKT